jgi:hypothetical protein
VAHGSFKLGEPRFDLSDEQIATLGPGFEHVEVESGGESAEPIAAEPAGDVNPVTSPMADGLMLQKEIEDHAAAPSGVADAHAVASWEHEGGAAGTSDLAAVAEAS